MPFISYMQAFRYLVGIEDWGQDPPPRIVNTVASPQRGSAEPRLADLGHLPRYPGKYQTASLDTLFVKTGT